MPWLDVSDVLTSPAIAGEGFVVVRRVQSVNDLGKVTVSVQSRQNAVGSVTPTGSNSLVREEAYQTSQKTIRVVTTFALRAGAETIDGTQYQPDLVFWHGNYYLVKSLNDYSSYGAGMVEADCLSFDFNDQPPP